MLEIGDKAPAFDLPDDTGSRVSLADFTGRKLVMFFYPKAMTPGCTKEACDFRDRADALLAAGFSVVGVSPDPIPRLVAFKERESLTYPLLSDEDHIVAEEYGAWGMKKNYGREYEGLIRSTFVVGGDGLLLNVYRNVRASGHVARVTRDLLGE
ncbi:MAG TPA: thioredoxin-dependent thiol peroxidase [Acidimicrobiia bacterium]|nr:thioredoxin-dependent thiol peroxidase [Acidimicrobiia bacterium]